MGMETGHPDILLGFAFGVRHDLEQVRRREGKHDVDSKQNHVCSRHRPTRRCCTLLLAPEHLIYTQTRIYIFVYISK